MYTSKKYVFVFVFIVTLVALITSVIQAQDSQNSVLEEAEIALQTGDAQLALELFRSAHDAYELADDLRGEADALYGMGRAKTALGDYLAGRIDLGDALEIYRDELSDSDAVARAYHQIALNYHTQGNTEQALEYYFTAQRFAKDEFEKGFILTHLADLQFEQRDLEQSERNYQEAYDIFFNLNDAPGKAFSAFNLGKVKFAQGDLKNGLDAFQEAVTLYQGLQLTYEEAVSRQRVGDIYRHWRELGPAQEYYSQALTLYQAIPNRKGEGQVVAALGDVYRQLDYETAFDTLDDAVAIQQDAGDAAGYAQTLNYLGEYYLDQGEYDNAYDNFRNALSRAVSIEDEETTAIQAHAYLGLARSGDKGNLIDFSVVLQHFDTAEKLYRDNLKDYWNSSRAFISHAWAYFEFYGLDRTAQAEQLFSTGLGDAEKTNDPRAEAEALVENARFYLLRMQSTTGNSVSDVTPKDVVNKYEAVLDALENEEVPILKSRVYIGIGDLNVLGVNYNDGIEAYENALRELEGTDEAILQADATNRLNQIYQLQGRYSMALEGYEEALTLLENNNNEFLNSALIQQIEAQILQNVGSLYTELGLYEEAESYLTEALEIQDDLDNIYDLALTYVYQGDFYRVQGDEVAAQQSYRDAENAAESSGHRRALALAQLGYLWLQSGSTDDINENFDSALFNFRSVRDSRGESDTFTAMGFVALSRARLEAQNQGANERVNAEIETAIRHFSDAYDQAGEANHIRGEGYSLLNLAQAYEIRKDTDQAERNYKRAQNHFQDADDFIGEGLALNGLGNLYLSQGEYNRAIETFDQLKLVYQSAGDRTLEGISLNKLGEIYQERGQYEQALTYYEQSLVAFEDPSDDSALQSETFRLTHLAKVYGNRGDLYREVGQFTAATIDLERAEELQLSVEDQDGRSLTLIAFGELMLARQEYETAYSYFSEAESIAAQFQNELVEGLACLGIANTYTTEESIKSNFADAERKYNCALRQFRLVVPNPTLARAVWTNWALAYMKMGDLETAQQYFNQAINEAQVANDQLGVAYARLEIGKLLLSQLQYQDAEKMFKDAQRGFQREDDWVGQADALKHLADLSIVQVRYDEAETYYEQMRTLYENNQDLFRAGQTLSLMGEIDELQSQYASALDRHLEGLSLVQSLSTFDNDESENALIASTEALIYRNIAAVQIDLALYTEASITIKDATQRADEVGNRLEQAITEHLSGKIAYLTNNYPEAIKIYESLVSEYDLFNEHRRRGLLYLDLGDAYYALRVSLNNDDDATRASIQYQLALSVGTDIGDISMATEARIRLGRIYNLLQDHGQAGDLLRAALDAAEAINSPRLQVNALIELGLLEEEIGNRARAIEYYQQSTSLIETVHSTIRLQSGQIAFAAQNITPYHRLVDYYASIGDDEQAFFYAESGRARTFLVQLGNEPIHFTNTDTAQWQEKKAELDSLLTEIENLNGQLESGNEISTELKNQITETITQYTNRIGTLNRDLDTLWGRIDTRTQVLAQTGQVNIESIDNIRAAIPENTTILAYYLVPSSSFGTGNAYVFVINKDNFELIQLDDYPEAIQTQVDNFNSVGRENIDNFPQKSLYTTLVTPTLDEATILQSGQDPLPNLIIVPHGTLNNLSFGALISPEERYLAEDYVLTYTPNVTFYTLLNNQQFLPLSFDTQTVLVLGNPDPGDRDFSTLNFAEQEAKDVADYFGIDALTGSEATESKIVEVAPNADVIHIAAHGDFRLGNPLSTNLVLAQDLEHDGSLEVREIYGLSLDKDPLVVLSACDTAKGQLSAGDELEGLTRAFLLSGARGVIASLWKVDDAATAKLMVSFYEGRASGLTSAQALAYAQKIVREDSEHPHWSQPKYWAAFILVGSEAS